MSVSLFTVHVLKSILQPLSYSHRQLLPVQLSGASLRSLLLDLITWSLHPCCFHVFREFVRTSHLSLPSDDPAPFMDAFPSQLPLCPHPLRYWQQPPYSPRASVMFPPLLVLFLLWPLHSLSRPFFFAIAFSACRTADATFARWGGFYGTAQ